MLFKETNFVAVIHSDIVITVVHYNIYQASWNNKIVHTKGHSLSKSNKGKIITFHNWSKLNAPKRFYGSGENLKAVNETMESESMLMKSDFKLSLCSLY